MLVLGVGGRLKNVGGGISIVEGVNRKVDRNVFKVGRRIYVGVGSVFLGRMWVFGFLFWCGVDEGRWLFWVECGGLGFVSFFVEFVGWCLDCVGFRWL